MAMLTLITVSGMLGMVDVAKPESASAGIKSNSSSVTPPEVLTNNLLCKFALNFAKARKSYRQPVYREARHGHAKIWLKRENKQTNQVSQG